MPQQEGGCRARTVQTAVPLIPATTGQPAQPPAVAEDARDLCPAGAEGEDGPRLPRLRRDGGGVRAAAPAAVPLPGRLRGRLPKTTGEATLRALITRNGGDKPGPDW